MFWHHLTTDHLIGVHGDEATVSAQFLVVNAIADPEPADGWPASPNPVRGAISALLAGYYEGRLIKTTDGWAFAALDIKHSLPIAAK
jgi:SnoaL-like protein